MCFANPGPEGGKRWGTWGGQQQAGRAHRRQDRPQLRGEDHEPPRGVLGPQRPAEASEQAQAPRHLRAGGRSLPLLVLGPAA